MWLPWLSSSHVFGSPRASSFKIWSSPFGCCSCQTKSLQNCQTWSSSTVLFTTDDGWLGKLGKMLHPWNFRNWDQKWCIFQSIICGIHVSFQGCRPVDCTPLTFLNQSHETPALNWLSSHSPRRSSLTVPSTKCRIQTSMVNGYDFLLAGGSRGVNR